MAAKGEVVRCDRGGGARSIQQDGVGSISECGWWFGVVVGRIWRRLVVVAVGKLGGGRDEIGWWLIVGD